MKIRRPILAALCAAGLAALPPTRADDPPAPKGDVVPFEMLPSNHMVVSARLNGKVPSRLVFDLGAPITLISSRAGEASGAIPRDAPKSFLFGMRGEGRVDELEVGDLEVKDLPVIVMDHPTVKALGDLTGKPLDGIVGFTLFARYKTSIDYKNKTMTFTPVNSKVTNIVEDLPQRMLGRKVARTRILAPRGVWGLVLGEPADDGQGVAVARVVIGSPADEAGLRAGDVLTTLDGRWTTGVADAYAAAAAVEPGQAVPVVVRRDGEERTLSVTPREGL